MPGRVIENWDDSTDLLFEATGQQPARHFLRATERVRKWTGDEFDFGVLVWRDGYLDLIVLAEGWLHDIESQGGGTTSASGRIDDIASITVVEDDASLRVEVTSRDGHSHWFWNAQWEDSRAAETLTRLLLSLQGLTGGH